MILAIIYLAETFSDFPLLCLKRIAGIRAATNGNAVFGNARFKVETTHALNQRDTPDEKPWSAPWVS